MIVAGVAIGWIHIMAAVVVLGGSFFINALLPRASEGMSPPELGRLNQNVGQIFGPVAWIATALIIITGVLRAGAIGVLNPSVLFGTMYGNLLLMKIVFLGAIIMNMALITRTGLMMAGLAAADGAPDMDAMTNGGRRIKRLGTTNLALGAIVVACAVAMRFVGAP